MSKVIVVTPTYNERENIEPLVTRIFSLGIPDVKMVAIDDNSPDGTGELLERLAKQFPLEVIHRSQKLGLGTAYVQAFQKILPGKPDFIIQLDADFSHNPEAIPTLLSKILECDVVLGSRYVPGGRIENWSRARKLLSRFGNLYARWVLGLPYRDLTGGFKCYRREALEKIVARPLSSVGYNFQIETLYLAHKSHCRICEVPITFVERKSGTSKINGGIIFESFCKVLAMRSARRRQPERNSP